MTQKDLKFLRNLEKKIEQWHRVLKKMIARKYPRPWFAHPDLCLYLDDYARWDWKYMIKIGAKKGHLLISIGWLRATIAW